MRVSKKDLQLGATYQVCGTCLVHGYEVCNYIGVLSYIGNTTFAFDANEHNTPKHQFRLKDVLVLKPIGDNNKTLAYMLDKEY